MSSDPPLEEPELRKAADSSSRKTWGRTDSAHASVGTAQGHNPTTERTHSSAPPSNARAKTQMPAHAPPGADGPDRTSVERTPASAPEIPSSSPEVNVEHPRIPTPPRPTPPQTTSPAKPPPPTTSPHPAPEPSSVTAPGNGERPPAPGVPVLPKATEQSARVGNPATTAPATDRPTERVNAPTRASPDGPTLVGPGADPIHKPRTTRPGDREPRPAVYRDPRGAGRSTRRTPRGSPRRPAGPRDRPPADAKLRLTIRPIRRSAYLSVVLNRPEGYPHEVTFTKPTRLSLEAFDDHRYDDLDLEIGLESEIRLASDQGYRWVRGARRIQIFTSDPSESGLISVGTARRGASHTVICRTSDVQAVQEAAAAVASPPPTPLNFSTNLPVGWTILANHIPQEPAARPLPEGLTPLDPGHDFAISFEGGLAIRPRAFAQGQPAAISISPDPADGTVTIDDRRGGQD